MLNTQVTKSNLAKLLATENISVEYQKTDTASFNVQTRTLVLPLLNDMTNEMEDLFIGHEVGHALDTPNDYGPVIEEMGANFHTFLNVVEDARIERLIKDRYPGLRKSFTLGYKQFMERDFFKVNNKDLSDLLLIDRINLYFKVGPFLKVDFTEEEDGLVQKVADCETFDDVIAVAKELYEYCKKEKEEKQNQQSMSEDSSYEENDDGEYESVSGSSGNDGEEVENDDDSSSNSSGNDEEQDAEEDDEGSSGWSHESGSDMYNGEVKSLTDENLKESLKNLSEKKDIRNGKLDKSNVVNYDKLVIPYKEIVGDIFVQNETYKNFYAKNALIEFESNNKNAISYMVKEFEMKKKAAELRRTTVADTGVLDTNKLHTYKFNDDIFRKVGSIQAGKNHGIVMFLDWSGSMGENFLGTIQQLITLTTFCRKVNIPFEVYAFSTDYDKRKNPSESVVRSIQVNDGAIEFYEPFNLLNLFSSRMKNTEYRSVANDLLNFGMSRQKGTGSLYMYSINRWFHLGGTPLNATIFAASELVNRFRKSYKVEVMNVIFLTDGEDTSTLYIKNGGSVGEPTRYSTSYITDQETNKRYRIGRNGVTPVLLEILKDRTKCNLIGFYILKNNKAILRNQVTRFGHYFVEDMYRSFRSEKFLSVKNYGYDDYFLIPGGDALLIEDDDLTQILGNETEVSTRKLTTAFLKMNKGRLTNRVLLTKVVEEIA